MTSGCSRQIEANLGAMKKLHKEHKEILDILRNKTQWSSFLDLDLAFLFCKSAKIKMEKTIVDYYYHFSCEVIHHVYWGWQILYRHMWRYWGNMVVLGRMYWWMRSSFRRIGGQYLLRGEANNEQYKAHIPYFLI